VSVVTRAVCPHERGVFIWLGDGPWAVDPADPEHGRYPYVHDTSTSPGHLEVCELMAFATAAEAGEVCACSHSSGWHGAGPGPIPAGRLAKPRSCSWRSCDCPDFRHWAEGRPMWALHLACGCDVLTHYVPGPGVGGYITCTAVLAHQTSYRIESVTQVGVEAKPLEAAPQATERPAASPAPSGPSVQLELFAVPAPDAADAGVPHGRRRVARKPPAHVPWIETVEVAGGVL
jgi:hypothetical protein